MKTDKNKVARAKPLSDSLAKSSRIPRFYRLSVEQRLAHLTRTFGLSDNEIASLRQGNALRIDHAVNMVENAVGIMGLPLGLAVNFLVDGKEYLVPMATEEASVIAGASKAALMIRRGGGFSTETTEPVMIGQIQIIDLPASFTTVDIITAHKAEIIEAANFASPRMVRRGGGVYDIEARLLNDAIDSPPMLIVHLFFKVCEAMGANAVNTACEAAAPKVVSITGGEANLKVVSNLADQRITRAGFRIPILSLADTEDQARRIAHRLVEAGRMAELDPYRAATHNKGIFNGIDAMAIALGQDWRAIEAGGHAYAARSGSYRSLTKYRMDGEILAGEIELPLQVGLIGGAVAVNPAVKILRRVTGVENSREMARLMAAVGLGQNFAACLALCTEGIQKGHMALHARSLAVSAGVATEDVTHVAEEMVQHGRINIAAAEDIYRHLRLKRAAVRPSPLPVESFVPGKVVLFGEHATVYGHPGIVAAVNVGLTVKIAPDPDGPRFIQPDFRKRFPIPDSDGDFRLFSRAADIALERHDMTLEPIAINIESDLIPGVGMGSSAAFAAAICRAFRTYKRLPEATLWNHDIFEQVQELERVFHGNPSGMDAAAVLSGGVIWFRRGNPREILPLRLPKPLSLLIAVVEPGARTVDMVRRVKQAYEKDPRVVQAILDDIGNLTVDAGISLGTGSLEETGRLMFRNHESLARLGVSTKALDSAVELALDNGALGAKLTGSGGGGAVIALVAPENLYQCREIFQNKYPVVYTSLIGTGQ